MARRWTANTLKSTTRKNSNEPKTQHVQEMLNQHRSHLQPHLLPPPGEELTVLPLREGRGLQLGAISHFAGRLFLGCLFLFIPGWCASVVRAILFDHTIHHRAWRDRPSFWLLHFGWSGRGAGAKVTSGREEEQVRTNSQITLRNSE